MVKRREGVSRLQFPGLANGSWLATSYIHSVTSTDALLDQKESRI